MKTIKNVQLISLMLLALSMSGFNTIPNHQTASLINTSESQKTEIDVVVKNAKGKVVYNTTIGENENISDRFELSNLPEGDYVIEKVYDLEIECQPFTVSQEEDRVADSNKVVFGQTYRIFKPVIMTRGELVYISRFAFQKNDLQIRIYNKFNELMYTERLTKSGRIFDLSEIKNEKVKFVVVTGGREYSETLKF